MLPLHKRVRLQVAHAVAIPTAHTTSTASSSRQATGRRKRIARGVDEVRGLTRLCAIDFRPLFDLEALPSPKASPSFRPLRPHAHARTVGLSPHPPNTHAAPTQTRTHAHGHADPPQATHLLFRRGRVGRRTHNLAKSGKLLGFSLRRRLLLSGQFLDGFAHILPSTRKVRRLSPGTRARSLSHLAAPEEFDTQGARGKKRKNTFRLIGTAHVKFGPLPLYLIQSSRPLPLLLFTPKSQH